MRMWKEGGERKLIMDTHFFLHCHVQVSYTPLGKASREGHSKTVSLLLQEGAHVSAVDDVSYLKTCLLVLM